MYLIISPCGRKAAALEPVTGFRVETVSLGPTAPEEWAKLVTRDLSNIKAGFHKSLRSEIKDKLTEVLLHG